LINQKFSAKLQFWLLDKWATVHFGLYAGNEKGASERGQVSQWRATEYSRGKAMKVIVFGANG
jgi:hypothetical protein